MNSDVQSFVGLLSVALLIILVMFAGLVAIPVGIGGGIFYFWFYKNKQKQREEEERAEIQALHRKVEAASYLTETDFRNAVHEKLGQDIYLDEAIGAMYEWEQLGEPPKFPEAITPIEIGRYKDQAAYFINNADHTDLVPAMVDALRPLVYKSEPGIFKATKELTLDDVQYLSERFNHQRYFKKLRRYLLENLQDAKEPADYIKDTPLELILNRQTSVSLKDRFSHTHILGTTGSGKTQLIQYLVAKDLEADCCVIVIDNQRQMIPKLSNLDADIQYISPHHPLEINLFDMPSGHGTASLLRYVLSGIMNARLTARQELIFEFGVTLVMSVNGNITTFQDLLDGKEFDLSKVDETTRRFFQTEYYQTGKDGYGGTRKEISWRLWSLLKNPILRDMFTAKENKCKLDLSKDMILIDADVDLLQDASAMFGRFFIAQLLQLAQSRFRGNPRPVYLYIDEFYYYVDEKLTSMLETARKAKMGLTLANQYMGQITEPKISSAVMALTNTKFASNLNSADLQQMSQAMRVEKEFIQAQAKGHFALYQGGENTVSIEVEFGYLENIVGDNPEPHEPPPKSEAESRPDTDTDDDEDDPKTNDVAEESDW